MHSPFITTEGGARICCNANCNQGRACPVRQACELPEDSAKPNVLASALRYGSIPTLIVIAFTALVFYFR